MFERVRQLIAAPIPANDEQSRVAGLLHVISPTVVVFGISASAAAALMHHVEVALALCIMVLGAVGSLLLSRRRHLKAATALLLPVLLGVINFLVYRSDGVHDAAMIAYPALIIGSGLLLSRRTFVAYVLLVVLSVFMLVLGEIGGFIVNRFSESTSHADMIYLLVILSTLVALSRLMSHSIARNLDRVRLARMAVDESNRELRRANTELNREVAERVRVEAEREKLIAELQEALDKAVTLRGLLPICASCKKIRDDHGYWHKVEAYIRDHSEADFSHSICPDCVKRDYPELLKDEE